MKPFITGSHAYGTPTSSSDIDLVLPPCDPTIFVELILKSDNKECPIRYNNLNLICPKSPEEYEVWKLGTEYLKSLPEPQTRLQAVAVFQQLAILHNLPDMFSPEPSRS
jgi:predicted nucleotidyltransferase